MRGPATACNAVPMPRLPPITEAEYEPVLELNQRNVSFYYLDRIVLDDASLMAKGLP
jgi:hypothetical protein